MGTVLGRQIDLGLTYFMFFRFMTPVSSPGFTYFFYDMTPEWIWDLLTYNHEAIIAAWYLNTYPPRGGAGGHLRIAGTLFGNRDLC